MPIIASIKQTSPGRLKVCFDDGTEIRSTLNTVTDMRLFSGKELDAEEEEELRSASARAIARERALEYLSMRPMSCRELRDKLIQKGEDEAVAEYCVSWLSENGLIDDAAYAASLARHYAAKGYGPGKVRSELSRRGISRELWQEAVDGMPDTDDKIDKFISSRLKDPTDREQIRKISGALYRRGHSWEDIRAALERFNAQTEEY